MKKIAENLSPPSCRNSSGASAGRYSAPVAIALVVASLTAATPDQALAAARRRAAAPSAPIVAAQPRNPAEMNNLAVQLGQRGQFEQAVNWHVKALEGDPYNAQFRTNLSAAYLYWGKALLAKNDTTKAMSKFRWAWYTDANNREAEELLDAAIKRKGQNPNDAALRQKMYETLDADGNYVEAIAEARKVVHMKDDGPSHYNLGYTMMKWGQQVPAKKVEGYQELVTALKKPWDKSPEQTKLLAECHCLLGACLFELAQLAQESNRNEVALKRLSNAGIEFRRAVTVEPNMSSAYQGLKEVANQAVSIAPTFNNYLTLASAYQLMGDFEHAKRTFEICYKMDKNNPALPVARRSFYLAVVSAPVPNPQFVANVMNKVEDLLRANANDAELLYIYGRGKQANGDREGAIRAYQKAVTINPYVNPKLQANLTALTNGGATGGGAPQTAAKAGPAGSLANATAMGGGAAAAGAATAPPPVSQEAQKKVAELQAKFQSGDLDGAEKLGSDILNEDQKNPTVWHVLGDVSRKKGDLEQAQANYRMASSLGDSSAQSLLDQITQQRSQPFVSEGDKHAGAGEFKKAIDCYQEAATYDPNSIDLCQKILDMYNKLGDKAKAAAQMQKIANLKTSSKPTAGGK